MRHYLLKTRRGNTIVLAVGILVLLAIVATSYLSLTHASRITSGSQQRAALRDDNAQVIARDLAQEIALQLFGLPVDRNLPYDPLDPASANAPRLAPRPDAVRYMADPTDLVDNTSNPPIGPPDGQPDFPWTAPSYAVVPWTNWPDPGITFTSGNVWPMNEDNPATFPTGGVNLYTLSGAGEGNPPGGPGFGDLRWLSDIEPQRHTLGPGADGVYGTPDDFVVFTHWRHMTNVARPNNGWRVCRDISNVFVNGKPNVVTDLSIPHEQWLSVVPQTAPLRFNLATGDAIYDNASFLITWGDWLRLPGEPGQRYSSNYTNPASTPLNLYNLRDLKPDLDGDGLNEILEDGERPSDEFVAGTPRWNVCRVLADADGDGYTDSYWFLAPAGVDRSIRQVVAVRIIDNSAMLNVNLAGRFNPNDRVDFGGTRFMRTKGTTPADLALVGACQRYSAVYNNDAHWNVGFFDNPGHAFDGPISSPPQPPTFFVRYDDDGGTDAALNLWKRHLEELGLQYLASPDAFLQESVRLDYWLAMSQSMLASEWIYPAPNLSYYSFSPFGIPEELELRMFYGNNDPWIYSRLERATQPNSQTPDIGILHGGASQEMAGSSEYLGKLTNAELVRDLRRQLTTYSGARNDVMPPWLWPARTLTYWDHTNPFDGVLNPAEQAVFAADTRKYDLRRSFFRRDGVFDQDVNGDGAINALDDLFPPVDLNNDGVPDGDGAIDFRDHYARLQQYLEHVLVDVEKRSITPPFQPTLFQSYFGTSASDLRKSYRAAASLTANILAYRDGDPDGAGPLHDEPLSLPDAVIWSDPVGGQKYGYIGMEAQPFLVEAFIAHVYKWGAQATIDHANLSGDPPIKKDDLVVCDSSSQGTIVAVQIANPYDVAIAMGEFSIKMFGSELLFRGTFNPLLDVPLLPGHARTYFAMVDSDAVAMNKWRNLLGLDPTAPTNPLVDPPIDVTNMNGGWKTTRGFYDGVASDQTVELVRYVDDGLGGTGKPVVVDRIDIRPANPPPPPYRSFGAEVADADNAGGATPPPTGACAPEPQPTPADPGASWPGVINLCRIDPNNPGGARLCNTHLVHLAWACRPWQIDRNGNGVIEDNERNPRFVFANRRVQRMNKAQYNESDPPDQWLLNATQGNPPLLLPPKFDALNKGSDVNNYVEPGAGSTLADRLNFPMQMLQKDADFEQVGELYNVWLFGHELDYGSSVPPTFEEKTINTFSEFLYDDVEETSLTPDDLVRANRLRVAPAGSGTGLINPFLGKPRPGVLFNDARYAFDPCHGTPRLTAGARALEAFVCDGPGRFPDINGDGAVSAGDDLNGDNEVDGIDYELRSLRMAAGFSGHGTPALINLETATPEVLQSLPGWERLLYDPAPAAASNPYVHLPQGVVRYRDRLGDPRVGDPNVDPAAGLDETGPGYLDRGMTANAANGVIGFDAGLRQSRGLAGVGELLLLTRPGKWGKFGSAAGAKYGSANPTTQEILYNSSFCANFAQVPEREAVVAQGSALPLDPYLFWSDDQDGDGLVDEDPADGLDNDGDGLVDEDPPGPGVTSARVTTDVVPGYKPGPQPLFVYDHVAEDVEEANMLVAGASNLVTTRSDVFTVYFKVRSFRQNPVSGRWDATDPEMIVDESRYVMLVDRSEVNHPGDKPKIVYLEKLPQ